MAQLIVLNVEDSLVKELKRPAGEHGRSTQAGHREMLRSALEGPCRTGSQREWLLEVPDPSS